MFKSEDELRYALELGNSDFIVDVKYWDGTSQLRPRFCRQIMGWGNAYNQVGYELWCDSIDEVLKNVNYLVSVHKDEYEFIYFRVHVTGFIPKICYVDMYVRGLYDIWSRDV